MDLEGAPPSMVSLAGRYIRQTKIWVTVLALGIIVYVGDWLITWDACIGLCRALADSSTHAAIGVLSWFQLDPSSVEWTKSVGQTREEESRRSYVKCRYKGPLWIIQLRIPNALEQFKLIIHKEMVIVLAMSSLIDLDHFIEAGSLHLKDATSLNHRPFAHQLIFIPLLFILVGSLTTWKLGWSTAYPWLLHLLRDGARRGVWIAGSIAIPTIPYLVYWSITVLAGVLLHIFSLWLFGSRKHETQAYQV
jgi:hypothetical protein